ncbi:MAG: XTP/dITP diphosphatase [candidate division Zixibacteria bacterium]|nr:XTP/dITP diphosphatase [candidate division Zixibacteria bacterium]
MKLFIATGNQHKIREITKILDKFGITPLTPAKGELPEVEETGKDLVENAILKAKAGYEFSGIPTIADDTGLEVEYLNGVPGVYSARYAGEGCTYDDNNRKLLSALEGVPHENRKARFRTVIALALDSNIVETVEGTVDGYIIDEKKGENGFGYDPVFLYPPKGKTFAELELDEKNKISHRANALIELEKLLSSGKIKL